MERGTGVVLHPLWFWKSVGQFCFQKSSVPFLFVFPEVEDLFLNKLTLLVLLFHLWF